MADEVSSASTATASMTKFVAPTPPLTAAFLQPNNFTCSSQSQNCSVEAGKAAPKETRSSTSSSYRPRYSPTTSSSTTTKRYGTSSTSKSTLGANPNNYVSPKELRQRKKPDNTVIRYRINNINYLSGWLNTEQRQLTKEPMSYRPHTHF